MDFEGKSDVLCHQRIKSPSRLYCCFQNFLQISIGGHQSTKLQIPVQRQELLHVGVSFLNLPRELVEDQGPTVVEYDAQKAALHISNAA